MVWGKAGHGARSSHRSPQERKGERGTKQPPTQPGGGGARAL